MSDDSECQHLLLCTANSFGQSDYEKADTRAAAAVKFSHTQILKQSNFHLGTKQEQRLLTMIIKAFSTNGQTSVRDLVYDTEF